jgi:hypothetical protein
MRALPDVLTYVTSAQSSANYIEPHMNADKNILYPQLFEELKTVLIDKFYAPRLCSAVSFINLS